jgi:hypothetical protein
MAKQRSEYELIIKATDAYSKEFDRLDRRVSESARRSPDGGDFTRTLGGAGFGRLANIGRTVGDIAGIVDAETVSLEAAQARNQAYLKYRETQQEVLRVAGELETLERKGHTNDSARVAASLLRRDIEKDTAAIQKRASEEYRQEVARINENERRQRLVGNVARGVGALVIASQGGRMLGTMGAELDVLAKKIRETNAEPLEIAGDVARSIPLLGDAVKGMDSLREGVDNVVLSMKDSGGITGTLAGWTVGAANWGRGLVGMDPMKVKESPEKILADAAAADARTKAIRDEMRRVDELVQNVQNTRDPIGKLVRDREDALKKINDSRAKSIIDEEKAEAARLAIITTAEEKITAIKAAEAENRRRIAMAFERSMRDLERDSAAEQIQALELQGQTVEARLAEIDEDLKRKIEDLYDRSIAALNDPDLTDAQKTAIMQAAEKAGADAAANARSRKGQTVTEAAQTVAERVGGVLQSAIATSDDPQVRALNQQLQIAEKYKKLRAEILELEKDGTLTEQQRLQLQQAMAGLSESERREREAAGVSVTARQGRESFDSSDARFTRSASAERSRVEVFTEKTATATAKAVDLLTQLLNRIGPQTA